MKFDNRMLLIAGIIVVIAAVVVALNLPKNCDYQGVNERAFKGNANAVVIVQEFSDFQCPACGAAFEISRNVAEEFKNEIRFEYRHFPLTSIHTQALKAAIASECANDQNAFWQYHDRLFEENQKAGVQGKLADFSDEKLVQFARDLGLDVEKFEQCLKCSSGKESIVNNDKSFGEGKNVQGTPTFFINGVKVQKWSQLKELVKAEIEKAE